MAWIEHAVAYVDNLMQNSAGACFRSADFLVGDMRRVARYVVSLEMIRADLVEHRITSQAELDRNLALMCLNVLLLYPKSSLAFYNAEMLLREISQSNRHAAT